MRPNRTTTAVVWGDHLRGQRARRRRRRPRLSGATGGDGVVADLWGRLGGWPLGIFRLPGWEGLRDEGIDEWEWWDSTWALLPFDHWADCEHAPFGLWLGLNEASGSVWLGLGLVANSEDAHKAQIDTVEEFICRPSGNRSEPLGFIVCYGALQKATTTPGTSECSSLRLCEDPRCFELGWERGLRPFFDRRGQLAHADAGVIAKEAFTC